MDVRDKENEKSLPWIFQALIVVAILALLVGLAIIAVDRVQTEKREQTIVQLQQEQASVIADVEKDIIASNENISGVTRIFDESNNLIMTLYNGGGSVDIESLPSSFVSFYQKEYLNIANPTQVTIRDWVEAQSLIYFLLDNSTEGFDSKLANSINIAALDIYARKYDISLSTEAKVIIADTLSKDFTYNDILSYCISNTSFAGIDGLSAAAATLFNKRVENLSDFQARFLVATAVDENIDWETWRVKQSDSESIPDVKMSGLVNSTKYSSLLRSKIMEELDQITTLSFDTTDYDVRVGLDSQMQQTLQNIVDSSLSYDISLQDDGMTSIDGTAILIDNKTGLVKAFVSGRSINPQDKSFTFPENSKLGVLEAAKQLFTNDSNIMYNSLIPIDSVEGETEFIPVGELIDTERLDTLDITPVLQPSVTLDELSNFCFQLYHDTVDSPRFVKQISCKDTGEIVYRLTGLSDTSTTSESVNLRSYLAGSSRATTVPYTEVYNNGIAFANMSSSYILCGLVGSNSLGYKLTEEAHDNLLDASLSIRKTIGDLMPETDEPIDKTGKFATTFSEVDLYNRQIVSVIADNCVSELTNMPIASKSDRITFEGLYGTYVNTISTYSSVIQQDFLEEQLAKLTKVKADRAEELLAFVA